MNVAIRKAEEILKEYGGDLDSLLEAIDVQVINVPLAGRLKELYFGDVIVVRQGLSNQECRELIAHALGHHFLHAGNHYAASQGAYSWDKYQERQAEVFAAYYLIPPDALERTFRNKTPINAEAERFKVAKKFNVTEKFADFRLKLYEAYERPKVKPLT